MHQIYIQKKTKTLSATEIADLESLNIASKERRPAGTYATFINHTRPVTKFRDCLMFLYSFHTRKNQRARFRTFRRRSSTSFIRSPPLRTSSHISRPSVPMVYCIIFISRLTLLGRDLTVPKCCSFFFDNLAVIFRFNSLRTCGQLSDEMAASCIDESLNSLRR